MIKVYNKNYCFTVSLIARLIAARESEIAVDNALDSLIRKNAPICKKQVRLLVKSGFKTSEVHVPQVDLACYDQLLEQVTSC